MADDDVMTDALVEVDQAKIDTFTDFPTKEAIKFQTWNRALHLVLGLRYFGDKADSNSMLMRSFERKSRYEMVLSKYQDTLMLSRMLAVKPYDTGEVSEPEKK